MATLVATASIFSSQAFGVEYDLTALGTQSLNVVGGFGGTAIVRDLWDQPTGTGVFKPFLSLQTPNGRVKIEQAYNTDGFTNLFMDSTRPQWNDRLRVGDLETVTIASINYFAFVLDANEPGGDKSLISVDNIRIYTSATDNTTSVGNNLSLLDNLGTLRWAMNNPTQVSGAFNIANWVKLDAAQENVFNNSNGGSGMADLVVFIPQAAFLGSLGTDYLWFYNLNGAHYSADKDMAAQSGFEEWSAYTHTRTVPPPPPSSVPDNGNTLVLLGISLSALGLLANRRK